LTNVKHNSALLGKVFRHWELDMVSLKEFERWMSTGQVSKRLQRSRQGVIHLAEARKLRAVKTAAGWLYDPESVEMFAEREAKSEKD
jgi:hypothetical protein